MKNEISCAVPEIIHAMPKVDLHYHLDGGIRPETMKRILSAQSLPESALCLEELRDRLTVKPGCDSLNEYLKIFAFILPLISYPDALKIAAEEAIREAASQNLLYLEVRFAPLALKTDKMDCSESIAAVIEGLRIGEEKYGVPANIIVCLMLHDDPEKNKQVVKAALPFLGKGVIAVDAAGSEADFPLIAQKPAIYLAKDLGFSLTLHAGEAGPAENVGLAADLGAQRIGHGTHLYQNPAIMERIARCGIGLEMCPTSNVHTKSVPSYAEFPLRRYFDFGIPVSICSDDPAISNIDLESEYLLSVSTLGFSLEELQRIVLNGLSMAFLPDDKKAALIAKAKSAF